MLVTGGTGCIGSTLMVQLAARCPGRLVIRLHSPDIAFDVQSALESAQLLLLACLGAARREFRVLAISDPVTAGDVSPLLNAFEARAVVGSP